MNKLPEKILSGTTRDMSVSHLLQPAPEVLLSERSLLRWVLPPWQRPEVWDLARKRAFIEGIFLGLGAGYYVVHEEDWDRDGQRKPMSGWLLDGQQRISAIRDFVQGEVVIFDGLRWGDLSELDRLRRFLRAPFPYVEIAYQDDERRLKEIYVRMNFGGMAHTEADLARLEDLECAQPPNSHVERNRAG